MHLQDNPNTVLSFQFPKHSLELASLQLLMLSQNLYNDLPRDWELEYKEGRSRLISGGTRLKDFAGAIRLRDEPMSGGRQCMLIVWNSHGTRTSLAG